MLLVSAARLGLPHPCVAEMSAHLRTARRVWRMVVLAAHTVGSSARRWQCQIKAANQQTRSNRDNLLRLNI